MRWLAGSLVQILATHSIVLATLAALISTQTLQNVLTAIGYPAVTLFVLIETTGIPFPGETMLLLAAFYAATNHQLQIPIIIACAALGAIVGDNLGYLLGRTGGRALVQRFGKFIFLKQHHLDYAEKFFAKHGDKTVFFGRFIAILRTWSAFLAGVNHMKWRSFLFYNAAGGILWAIIYGTLGFVAGRFFHDNFAQIEGIAFTIGRVGLVALVLFVIALIILFRIRRKKRLEAFVESQTRDDSPREGSLQVDSIQEDSIQKEEQKSLWQDSNELDRSSPPEQSGPLMLSAGKHLSGQAPRCFPFTSFRAKGSRRSA